MEDEVRVSFMVANVDGNKKKEDKDGNKKKENKEKAPIVAKFNVPEVRRKMVNKLTQLLYPDALLVQEVKTGDLMCSLQNITKSQSMDELKGKCYLSTKNQKSADSAVLVQHDLPDKNLNMGGILFSSNSKRQHGTEIDIARLSLNCILIKGNPDRRILCFSWHGAYKASVDDKQRELENMLGLVNDTKITIPNVIATIVAGDFNMEIDKGVALSKVEKNNFRILDYELTDRRKQLQKLNRIDYVLIDKTNTDVFPIVCTTVPFPKVEGREEYEDDELFELFNHDFLFCKLIIDPNFMHKRVVMASQLGLTLVFEAFPHPESDKEIDLSEVFKGEENKSTEEKKKSIKFISKTIRFMHTCTNSIEFEIMNSKHKSFPLLIQNANVALFFPVSTVVSNPNQWLIHDGVGPIGTHIMEVKADNAAPKTYEMMIFLHDFKKCLLQLEADD